MSKPQRPEVYGKIIARVIKTGNSLGETPYLSDEAIRDDEDYVFAQPDTPLEDVTPGKHCIKVKPCPTPIHPETIHDPSGKHR